MASPALLATSSGIGACGPGSAGEGSGGMRRRALVTVSERRQARFTGVALITTISRWADEARLTGRGLRLVA
jgi:hypothetical protein